MDRLTCKYDGINTLREMCTFDRESDIEAGVCLNCEEYCDTMDALGGDCDNCAIQKAFDKLAEYEDLEEKGLLWKFPCKIGDTVYSYEEFYIDEAELVEYQIRDIHIDSEGDIRYSAIGTYISDEDEEICIDMDFELRNIGESVFLTKEAAEQELERLSKQV